MTSKELDLLPCPFCGGEASYEDIPLDRAVDEHRWGVGCRAEECIGFQWMMTFARKRDAASAWNKRAPLATAGCVMLSADELETQPHCLDDVEKFDANIRGMRVTVIRYSDARRLLRACSPDEPPADVVVPSKFDLAFEVMRLMDGEELDTLQSCHFGYVLRVTREGSAPPPPDALAALGRAMDFYLTQHVGLSELSECVYAVCGSSPTFERIKAANREFDARSTSTKRSAAKVAVKVADKAIRAASKRLQFKTEKQQNEMLEYAAGSLAEAYRIGAEEAQGEIIYRLRTVRSELCRTLGESE